MILGKKNWNLLAAVISKLLELHISDADIDKFISYTESKRAKYQMQADNALKKWGFPENTQENIYEGLLNGCEGDLKAYLLTALIYIDSKLSFENKLSHFMEKGVAVSEMLNLNTNVEDTRIILLPRAECIWEKKKRSGLRSLMTNYIYIHKDDLGEYKIQNYVMNPNANDILKNRKRLRIAVSPLTNANVLQLDDYERDDIKRIAIKGLGCTECSKEILDKKVLWGIQKACQQDVDIMMYPEMLGTETIVQQALTRIAEIEFSPDNKVKKPPFLTLLPTVWINDDSIAASQVETCGMQGYKNGNNTNTLYAVLSKDILDGETYKAAIKQQKQNPYLALEGLYDGRIEDIQSDKVIHVLHISGIGRIVLPICADLINEKYREKLLHVIDATLILCPSFSKGFDDFIQITASGNVTGCQMIWCNSCAVQHLYKDAAKQKFEVGDICCANINGMKRTYKAIKPYPKCNNECKAGCLFYIDIPMTKEILKADAVKTQWTHLIEDNLLPEHKEG